MMVAPDTTVGDVLQLLRTQRIASVLVCGANTRDQHAPMVDAVHDRADGQQDLADGKRGGSMVGIFTERDALKWMAAGQRLDQPISEVMSRSPVAVTDEATVGQAIQIMAAGGYRHLPILATSGTPVGMAVVHGIVHYLVDHFPETIYTLPPTPDSVPSEREGA
jgi:CBS domain-containing protein